MKRILAVPLVLALALCGGDDGTGPLTNDDFAPGLGIDLDAMTRTGSGLYYQDLAAGTGEEAVTGTNVTVHYVGWLSSGSQFDSSRDRGAPFQFALGTGSVIAGFDEGVSGMRVGGLRKLVIPPKLGYGSAGAPPSIPGQATLVFEVELLDVS